jgi:anti-sigma-K factor RskA
VMSSEADESIKFLVPLYVRGLLDGREKAEFERALAERPELGAEVRKWRLIGDAYGALEAGLPQPSPWIYSRITGKLQETGGRSLFQRLMPAARLSYALISVQLVIIIALGVYVMNLRTEYRTLSAPSTATDEMVRINVVFAGDASEAEIRRLLTELNGRIIDGPYSSGLYVIGIVPEMELEGALNRLRADRIVMKAERGY